MPVLSKKNAPAVHAYSQGPSDNLNVPKNDKVGYVEFNMFLKDFWTILALKLCCEILFSRGSMPNILFLTTFIGLGINTYQY